VCSTPYKPTPATTAVVEELLLDASALREAIQENYYEVQLATVKLECKDDTVDAKTEVTCSKNADCMGN